jgi:phage/plasmid-like protein (TIGR03299 family)
MNTLSAAETEGERTGAVFSFRHSRKWRDRIEEAKEAITGVRTEMAAYKEMAENLLITPVTMGERELFIAEFIPMPPQGLITDRVAGNVEASRAALRNIFDSVTTAGVADTAYGLLQGATEYADHVRNARSWETRLNRSLMRPEPLKAKAFSLIQKITDGRIKEFV